MAVANFELVIPLDEVIYTMEKIGRNYSYELRCTALGNLSITKTSKKIEEQLARGALFEKTAPCNIWTPRKSF